MEGGAGGGAAGTAAPRGGAGARCEVRGRSSLTADCREGAQYYRQAAKGAVGASGPASRGRLDSTDAALPLNWVLQ